MIIAGYKLYQLLLFFGLYSIIGYAIEQILYGFSGYAVKRGFLAGPACIMYGLGSLIAVIFVMPACWNLYMQIVVLAVVSIVINAVAALLIRIISGVFLWRFTIGYSLIGTAFGLLLVRGAHQAIASAVFMLPTWLDMILLLVILVPMVSQFIDGVASLFTYRRDMARLEGYRAAVAAPAGNCAAEGRAICDHKAYGEAAMFTLQSYARWIKGYPRFRRATLNKVFRGCGPAEVADIKGYMGRQS